MSQREDFANLSSRELMLKMDEAKAGAIETGEAWAHAAGKYKKLKETIPIFMAELQRQFIEKSIDATVAMAKVYATSEPAYRKQVEEMCRAEEEANLLQAKYRAYIESIKAISAISWVVNQEMKLAG